VLLPFIAGEGGWKRVVQVAAGGGGGSETGGTAEWWRPWSELGRHGRRRYSDTGRRAGPHGFLFFPNYPNWLKLEN
jgi:hypothetical protein